MNRILASLVMVSIATTAIAQSDTNSPYSQFGLGDLSDQSVGFNKGMNGVGIAMRKGNEVNPLNPASYSSVDSLSMIFDAGLSGQITNFNENGKRLNGKSGGFDYVVGLFRAFRNVGVSFGMLPFSNIGYKYGSTTKLDDKSTTVESTYSGNGGLHQLFIGAGWRVAKPLSIGFNFAYLWGEYERNIEVESSSSLTTLNDLKKKYEADISNYKLDFGLQYEQPIGKDDKLTLGATFSPGHSLKSDPKLSIISDNSVVSKADTTTFIVSDGLKLPTAFGVGLSYSHATKLRLGADLRVQKWGGVDFPTDDGNGYHLKSGILKDSYRVNVGGEWLPNQTGRYLIQRVRYRIGAGYATPYYNISGQNGPKELSVSLGFGIPIQNSWNSRSILNISGQWVNRSADNLIKENTFRINIGLTFNERWFAKWKVE